MDGCWWEQVARLESEKGELQQQLSAAQAATQKCEEELSELRGQVQGKEQSGEMAASAVEQIAGLQEQLAAVREEQAQAEETASKVQEEKGVWETQKGQLEADLEAKTANLTKMRQVRACGLWVLWCCCDMCCFEVLVLGLRRQ